MSAMTYFFQKLYDFVLPSPPICGFCSERKADEQVECMHCLDARNHLKCETGKNDAICCYYYDGIIRDMVLNFKYHRREYLCSDIAREIADRIVKEEIDADYIAFIPLHPSKRRKRGFDQSKSVADALSDITGIPTESVLKRIKKTKTQARLDPEARKQNVKNAFIVKKDESKFKDSVIILLDDVYTTGATMDAAKAALKSAGVKRVIPVTFAVSTYDTHHNITQQRDIQEKEA